MTDDANTIKFHRVPLNLLRKRLGDTSEFNIAAKIIEEINALQEIKFELKSTTFSTDMGASKDGKILGFQPFYYSRWVNVLSDIAAAYKIPVEDGCPTEERVIFHARPGYLFVVTVRASCELLQAYTCKQFPNTVAKLANKEVINGWKIIPPSNPLYKLTAFTKKLTKDIKLKCGDGFVQFNLDKMFMWQGLPEMLNYLIEECQLCNEEEHDKTEKQ